MSAIEIKKMDEGINSDIMMLATNSFNNILYQVQDSCLNYHLQVSPFSAVISIKKSFVKDRSGSLILPPGTVSASSNRKLDVCDKESQAKLQQDLEILQQKHEDILTELTSAYERIELLKKKNQEQENTINELSRENRLARDATYAINKAHNDARVMYEKDKFQIFKQHKVEVKSWRRELGEMTRKHIKLEKKLKLLTEENVPVPTSSIERLDNLVLKEGVIELLEEDFDICSLCGVNIRNYVPDYFFGEIINPACIKCKGPEILDPFSSFPDDGIPSSLSCHWIPALSDFYSFTPSNLSTMPSMRAHYVRIPNPGSSFTAMEDVLQEFRVIWRAQRQEMLNDCKQS